MKEYYWVTVFNRNRDLVKQVRMRRDALLSEFLAWLTKNGFEPLNDAFYYNKETGYKVIFNLCWQRL